MFYGYLHKGMEAESNAKKTQKNNTVSLDYLENTKKYHTDVRLALFFKL